MCGMRALPRHSVMLTVGCGIVWYSVLVACVVYVRCGSAKGVTASPMNVALGVAGQSTTEQNLAATIPHALPFRSLHVWCVVSCDFALDGQIRACLVTYQA